MVCIWPNMFLFITVVANGLSAVYSCWGISSIAHTPPLDTIGFQPPMALLCVCTVT